MPDYEICADCGHAKIETYTCKCSDLEDEIQQLREWQAAARELLARVELEPHDVRLEAELRNLRDALLAQEGE